MIKLGLTLFVCTALVSAIVARRALAFDRIYERTPAGMVEVKELPARAALAASSPGSYFDQDNGLFMTLFDYIKANDVAMTVPVEANVEEAQMRFLVGEDRAAGPLPDSDSVSVIDMPAQTVVSLGLRGGYSNELFDRGRARLESWLAEHPDWTALSEPYAVYWDGPYMPVPMRRSEIHIPIAPAAP